MIKKFSIILITLAIALGSLSCTAGRNDEKNTTEESTTVSTEIVLETTTEPITEATTISTTVQATTERTTERTTEPTANYTEETNTTEYIEENTKKNPNVRPTVPTKKATVTTADGKNLGSFKITVYTPGSDGGAWGYQTATGVRSQHLSTCAVDPDVIPLGSTIQIDGLTLLACDTGSAVQGNVIDIFYDGSDGEACEWVSNFGTYHNVQKV